LKHLKNYTLAAFSLLALAACQVQKATPAMPSFQPTNVTLTGEAGQRLTGAAILQNGGGSAFDFAWVTTPDSAWLTLTAASGVVASQGQLTLNLSAVCPATVFDQTTTVLAKGNNEQANLSASLTVRLICSVPVKSTPDSFRFSNTELADPGEIVTSNEITVSGINVAVPLEAKNASVILNGTASSTTSVNNGDRIRLVSQASRINAGSLSASLTLGSVQASWSIGTADLIPDAFTFSEQTDVAIESQVTSNEVMISGINKAVSFNLNNAGIIINGNDDSTNSKLKNGDKIKLRLKAASSAKTSSSGSITIAGIGSGFKITTAPETPTSINFPVIDNAIPGEDTTTEPITVSGYPNGTSISVSEGVGLVVNGVEVASPASIKDGDRLSIKVSAPSGDNQSLTITITIAGQTISYTIRSGDATPDPLSFPTITNALPGTLVRSNIVTISGITVPIPVSITGGTLIINGQIIGQSSPRLTSQAVPVSTVLRNGDTLQVQVQASSDSNSSTVVTVRVGTGQVPVVVETGNTNQPNFSLQSQDNVIPGQVYRSNSIYFTSLTVPTTVSLASNPENQAVIYVNDLPTQNQSQVIVRNGDLITLHMQASPNDNSKRSATLTLGGGSNAQTTSFNLTSGDTTLDPLIFMAQGPVALDSTVVSNEVTVTGITLPVPVGITSITNAQFIINGQLSLSNYGFVKNGDRLKLSLTSAKSENTSNNAQLVFGYNNSQRPSFSVTTGNLTPTAFSFIHQNNIYPNSLVESNTVTISGLSIASPISVVGGKYKINNGPYSDQAGMVQNGDHLTLQLKASSSDNSESSATVSIGTATTGVATITAQAVVSASFSITTGDITPDIFSFIAKTAQPLGGEMISNEVTVTGISLPVPISIIGGSYQIDAGGFTTTAGNISNGQKLKLELSSSSSENTLKEAEVSVGSSKAKFGVTTGSLTPTAFGFINKTNIYPNSLVESNTVTITGLSIASPISFVGGKYKINNGSYSDQAAMVQNGDSLTLQVKASSNDNSQRSTTVSIGAVTAIAGQAIVSASFSVTTGDTTPDAFDFLAQTSQPLGSEITSNEVTITGLTLPVPISIIGGSYQIDAGGFTTTAGSISNGQKLKLKLTSASSENTLKEAEVDVNGSKAKLSVTTGDATPNAISFIAKNDQLLNSEITSNEVTITGISLPVPISIVGGSYQIDAGGFTTTAGSISNGQKLRLKLTSSSSENTLKEAEVDVGGSRAKFRVTTGDISPNIFIFNSLANQALNTLVESNSIVISGISIATPISIIGGQYSINGGSFVSTAGVVSNNQSIKVRHTTSSSALTDTTTTLTIGGLMASFKSTTLAQGQLQLNIAALPTNPNNPLPNPANFSIKVTGPGGYNQNFTTTTLVSSLAAGNYTISSNSSLTDSVGNSYPLVGGGVVVITSAAITSANISFDDPTIVKNQNDSGPASLRGVIAAVNPGTSIGFLPTVTNITLSSGALIIDKNLTISATGPHPTVSGNTNSQVLRITTAASVVINKVNLENGKAADGGAGQNGSNGGCIYAAAASHLLLDNLTVSHCAAGNGGAGGNGGDGGCIYSDTTTVLNLDEVDINNCTAGDGGSGGDGGDGGAVYAGGSLDIEMVTISNNKAGVNGSGGVVNGNGGAIYAVGKLMLCASTVADNSLAHFGGAVYGLDDIEIEESTISGNSADNGAGVYANGPLDMVNSTISGNIANGSGGGIKFSSAAIINFSTIVLNQAGNSGGGILGVGTHTISNSVVAGNIAASDPQSNDTAAITATGNNYLDGRAIPTLDVSALLGPLEDNDGPTKTHVPKAALIDKAICDDNVSQDQRGQSRCIDLLGASNHCDIGAVEVQALVSVAFVVANSQDSGAGSLRQTVLDSQTSSAASISFASNLDEIVLTSGEIAIDHHLTITGNVAITSISGNNNSRIFNIGSNADVLIEKMTIKDGKAADGLDNSSSMTLQAGGDGQAGGCIYSGADSNLSLNLVTITGCQAGRGGAGSSNSGVGGNGGAGGSGGGVYAANTLSIKDSTLNTNSAGNSGNGGAGTTGAGGNGCSGCAGNGGAVYATGSLTLAGSNSFGNNHAGNGGNGGASTSDIGGDGGNGGSGGAVYAGSISGPTASFSNNLAGSGGLGGSGSSNGNNGTAGIGDDIAP
jgi:hypothetical protein